MNFGTALAPRDHALLTQGFLRSGNLIVRDLSDIVTPEHVVESEYLTTLFVVVNKYILNVSIGCDAMEALTPKTKGLLQRSGLIHTKRS